MHYEINFITLFHSISVILAQGPCVAQSLVVAAMLLLWEFSIVISDGLSSLKCYFDRVVVVCGRLSLPLANSKLNFQVPWDSRLGLAVSAS